MDTPFSREIAGPEPAGRPLPVDDDALLYEAEAAYLLGESVRTLQGHRISGDGPRFVKFGRAVRYMRRELRHYAEERLRRSTSDRGQAA